MMGNEDTWDEQVFLDDMSEFGIGRKLMRNRCEWHALYMRSWHSRLREGDPRKDPVSAQVQLKSADEEKEELLF